MSGREARLKEAYADEYPGLTPGVWMPVKEFARRLVERVHQGRKLGRFTRTFDPSHFEFRGGPTKSRSTHARTRSTDRRPPSSEGLDSAQERPLQS